MSALQSAHFQGPVSLQTYYNFIGKVPVCVMECISLHCISSLKILSISFPQLAYTNYKLYSTEDVLVPLRSSADCKISTIADCMNILSYECACLIM